MLLKLYRSNSSGELGVWERDSWGVRLFLPAAHLLILAVGCGETTSKVPPAMNHIVEARRALAEGDQAKALESLTASIETDANVWAYYERAKIQLDRGDDQAATADCQALLELEPNNRDGKWLLGEIEKPAEKRFQGAQAQPPSSSK